MADSNEAQIRNLIESWGEAVRNADMVGVLANHSEDVIMFDVPPPFQSKGINDYKKTWELFFNFQGKGGTFNFDEMEIAAGDSVGFCHTILTCGGKDKSQQFKVQLSVGVKKVNGKWIITHEHHSVPAE